MASKGKFHDWVTDDGLLVIQGWARDGLTDKQIAKNIGIAEKTFCVWKDKFESIATALKKGKAPVDYEVENALLKSALGHTVTVRKPVKVKVEKQKVGQGKVVEEHIEYVDEEIYVPPSNIAQIFWLKNRRPDKWRDKPQPTQAATMQDDGFIDALKSSAEVDWSDDDGTEQE